MSNDQSKLKIIIALLVIIGLFVLSPKPSQSSHIGRDAVIVIPGIMGSWNWKVLFGSGKDFWRFPPGVKIYDPLIKFLKDSGWEEGENLFVYFYDWRQRNQDSAKKLKNLVRLAQEKNPSGEVTIIGHSMGGLVARSYMQGDVSGSGHDVNQLIMLGTPNLGSSDVYTLWQGGEVPKNWDRPTRTFILSYLWFLDKSFNPAKHYQIIHDKIPSIEQLLPTYPYLVEAATGNERPQPSNFFLSERNTPDALDDLTSSAQHIVTVAGNGQSTVNTIPVVDSSETSPRWEYGRPEPNPPVRNDANGDNRVLVNSGHLPPVISSLSARQDERSRKKTVITRLLKILRLARNDNPGGLGSKVRAQQMQATINEVTLDNVGHGQLPAKASQTIAQYLNTEVDQEPSPIPDPTNLLTILASSPVMISVTDPAGRTINLGSNQIPGAEYDDDGLSNGKKLILIPEPLAGQYQVTVDSVGEGGQYQLGTMLLAGEAEASHSYQGFITPRVEQQVALTVDSSANRLDVQAPPAASRHELWEKLRLDLSQLLPKARQLTSATQRAERQLEQSVNQYQASLFSGLIYETLVRSQVNGLLRPMVDIQSRQARLRPSERQIILDDLAALRQIYLAILP